MATTEPGPSLEDTGDPCRVVNGLIFGLLGLAEILHRRVVMKLDIL